MAEIVEWGLVNFLLTPPFIQAIPAHVFSNLVARLVEKDFIICKTVAVEEVLSFQAQRIHVLRRRKVL